MSPLAHCVQARVVAGDVSIPYVQQGDGPTIVLLRDAPPEASTSLLSWGALSQDYRVVAPVLERGGLVHVDVDSRVKVAFARWLPDFLDGLGLVQVALVAEEPFGVAALAYALSDPERVKRIALVFRDTQDPGVSALALSDGLARTGTSLLVVCVGAEGGGGAAADVIRFLDARTPAR